MFIYRSHIKAVCTAMAVIVSMLAFCTHAYAANAATAEAAILIECNSNRALYEKNADKRLPMASTTKIMTALTALRYFDPQTEMAVPKEAVGIEGTSACLCEGEVYTLESLLYAMLLQSANDAAAAIAINIGKSIEGFAVLMNQYAKELGLVNSNFKNPHGLPDSEHYTSARELAVISSHALKNECIRKITATKNAKIQSADGKVRYFSNHNQMLSLYQGANGVKTGYTKSSGRCLVSSACRDGLQLVAVTLHSHDDWNEHENMLDWGFENYEAVSASSINGLSRFVPVIGDGAGFVCATSEDVMITVKKGELDSIKVVCECPRFLYSPVRESSVIGRNLYYCNEELVASSPIVSSHTVETIQ